MFYTRLDELCKKNGTSVAEVAEKVLYVSSGTPTGWKNGASPKASVVIAAARYFNVSADYLLGIIDEKKPIDSNAISLTDIETKLIMQLRSAESELRTIIYRMTDAVLSTPHEDKLYFSNNDEYTHHMSNHSYKRSEGKAAAGMPIEAIPEVNDAPIVSVPQKYTGANYFIVEAQGDSMINAGISSGDFCVFQTDAHQDEGAIVLAQIIDGASEQYSETIKRLYVHADSIELRSANLSYPPQYYRRDEVQIAGVLVYIAAANNAL